MTKKEITKMLGQIGFLSSGTGFFMEGGKKLAPVAKTGGRAMVIGEPATHSGHPTSNTADLMGGKKLILSGKDKGLII